METGSSPDKGTHPLLEYTVQWGGHITVVMHSVKVPKAHFEVGASVHIPVQTFGH